MCIQERMEKGCNRMQGRMGKNRDMTKDIVYR